MASLCREFGISRVIFGPKRVSYVFRTFCKGSLRTVQNQIWRRGGDLNPRYGCPYARFRGECFQPLSHLSADGEARLAEELQEPQCRAAVDALQYKIREEAALNGVR